MASSISHYNRDQEALLCTIRKVSNAEFPSVVQAAERQPADTGAEDDTQEVLQILQERTVVPLEALEMTAGYHEALVELPSYISDGVKACIQESSRSVKSVE